jgi:hypothetical protein
MTYVSTGLRRLVRERALGRCEYCRLHEDDAFWSHHVDHIYAEKHGGETVEDNLCLSCADCNRHKGSDLCSIDPITDEIVSLFHPRHDTWSEHFQVGAGEIQAQTPQARITMRLLHFNDEERVLERQKLEDLGDYPGI